MEKEHDDIIKKLSNARIKTQTLVETTGSSHALSLCLNNIDNAIVCMQEDLRLKNLTQGHTRTLRTCVTCMHGKKNVSEFPCSKCDNLYSKWERIYNEE